jgi:site-specific DNA recombinase
MDDTTSPRERAVVYRRQSTSREDSISLDEQREICLAYCRRTHYEVVTDLVDPGISGLDVENRPGLLNALELIEQHEADVIVVYDWSRLSRDELDQITLIYQIERAGARVESATEGDDPLLRGILQKIAADESQKKGKRWRSGKRYRVDKLKIVAGGAPPYGYRRVGKHEPPEPDPDAAPIVKEMYERYLRGQGPQSLSDWLNNEVGVTTARGKPWHVTAVTRLLDGGFAAGYLDIHDPACPFERNNGKLRRARDNHTRKCKLRTKVKLNHVPIIDEQMWHEYQVERKKRQQVDNSKARHPRHWHLGGGLTVCGRCGGNLNVNSYEGVSSKVLCSTYTRRRTCAGVWIQRPQLETVVALWLGGHVQEWAEAQDAVYGTDDERNAVLKAIEAERTAERDVTEGLASAARMLRKGKMREPQYEAEFDAAQGELQEIADRVAELTAQLDALNPNADVYERLARGDDASPEEFNALLKRIIRRVVVGPDTVVIEPWRGEPRTYDRSTLQKKVRTDYPKRDATGRFVRPRKGGR